MLEVERDLESLPEKFPQPSMLYLNKGSVQFLNQHAEILIECMLDKILYILKNLGFILTTPSVNETKTKGEIIGGKCTT